MSIAERQAYLDDAVEKTRIEAALYQFFKSHPEVVSCEANAALLTVYCTDGFQKPSLDGFEVGLADPACRNRLALKSPPDLDAERVAAAHAEANRIHKLGNQNGKIADFSARTRDAVERQEGAEPKVTLKNPTSGEVIETAQQIKALSAPDLQKLMSRPRSLARLNEILAGK
jgi:hypothetical protein